MRKLPPDAFVAVAFALAVLLEWLVPLHIFPGAWPPGLSTLIGLLLAVTGLGLEIVAARALARARTTTRPGERPAALVTEGVFSVSRNPFYCGLLLLVSGLLLVLSLDWLVVLLPALWLALDRWVVPGEERLLAEAFGADFQSYRAHTRRWL